MSDLKLAVIGAGVVGLTTALELQKEFRNAKIVVISKGFNTQTTSNVAPGIFCPSSLFAGPTEDITKKWISDAFNYWSNIQNTEGINAGVVPLSGYLFSNLNSENVRTPYLEDLVPIYRRATEEELHLCPGEWKYGSFFTTSLIQCSEYLPWATSKFLASGGTMESKAVGSFADFSGNKYDAIVNCAGLGAKWICNDRRLVPLRGQVLKVKAPWIKTFVFGDHDTYIIPGLNFVSLGGCRQFESYNTEVDKYDSMAIKDRCEKLVPSLKNAELIKTQVGLRPYRDTVRVEKERIRISGNSVKVVHNYGHGGYGVTTSPGTSLYAVKLVRELLAGNSKL